MSSHEVVSPEFLNNHNPLRMEIKVQVYDYPNWSVWLRKARAWHTAERQGLASTACRAFSMSVLFDHLFVQFLVSKILFFENYYIKPHHNVIPFRNANMTTNIKLVSELLLCEHHISTRLNKGVVNKHTMCYRPKLHSYWNGICQRLDINNSENNRSTAARNCLFKDKYQL